MRGLGRASAAISIVNALPTGFGAAAALRLGLHAAVELRRAGPGEVPEYRVRPEDTPLLRATVGAALRAYAPLESNHVLLDVESSIPPGRGLKSSSAVTVAVFEAIAIARGHAPPPEEVARRSADLAQQSGQSATGAFDDAVASAAGGVVMTDNRRREVLARAEMPPELLCALLIPPAEHAPSPQLVDRFAGLEEASTRAFEAARDGRLLEAMARNSELVERAMGYRVAATRDRLVSAGAELVTVTGMGPALAVLVRPPGLPAVLDELGKQEGRVIVSGFRRAGETVGGSPEVRSVP